MSMNFTDKRIIENLNQTEDITEELYNNEIISSKYLSKKNKGIQKSNSETNIAKLNTSKNLSISLEERVELLMNNFSYHSGLVFGDERIKLNSIYMKNLHELFKPLIEKEQSLILRKDNMNDRRKEELNNIFDKYIGDSHKSVNSHQQILDRLLYISNDKLSNNSNNSINYTKINKYTGFIYTILTWFDIDNYPSTLLHYYKKIETFMLIGNKVDEIVNIPKIKSFVRNKTSFKSIRKLKEVVKKNIEDNYFSDDFSSRICEWENFLDSFCNIYYIQSIDEQLLYTNYLEFIVYNMIDINISQNIIG